MDNKHTTDILKTRGEIKEGSNGTTPALSQPKKPEYKSKKLKYNNEICIGCIYYNTGIKLLHYIEFCLDYIKSKK